MDDTEKKVVYNLAKKITDANKINSLCAHIMQCCNSVSPDKSVKKYNEKTIKDSIESLRKTLNTMHIYAEELEAHVFDGRVVNDD